MRFVVDVETRILSVPTHAVNEELAVQQAFGWRLVQTSSRSYATGAGVVGAGMHVGGGIVVGGGRASMRNAHFMDLTLQRAPSPRSAWLANLEERYDSVTYRDRAPLGITVGVAIGVFAVGAYGSFGPATAAGDNPVFLIGIPIALVAGIVLGVLARRAAQRRRDETNRASDAEKARILQQARTGTPSR